MKTFRVCGWCEKEKPSEEFYIKPNGKLFYACKECMREYNRYHNKKHRENNLEEYRAKERKKKAKLKYKNKRKLRDKNNPGNWRASYYKRVAREKNAEGEFSQQEWEDILELYDHTCLCCKRKEPEIYLTVDHVIPLSRGGSNYISNIQPLCIECNKSKFTKTIDYRIDYILI